MNRQTLDELKRQIPLMGYLQSQDWHPARPLSRGRWMGLCPLHRRSPTRASLVDADQDLFYCYGCGRGGDVIRFAELYHQVKFPQAGGVAAPMARAPNLCCRRSHVSTAFSYTDTVRRFPICTNAGSALQSLIEHMRIGYAPGRSSGVG